MTHLRLFTALASYGALAALAFVLVGQRQFRTAVLLLFLALAAKTLIAWKSQK
jgi:hypothetical protein